MSWPLTLEYTKSRLLKFANFLSLIMRLLCVLRIASNKLRREAKRNDMKGMDDLEVDGEWVALYICHSARLDCFLETLEFRYLIRGF